MEFNSAYSAKKAEQDRLLFLEATTGKRLANLAPRLTEIKHFYHPQLQAIYLVGHRDDQLVIQKYDYPLHQPWHIIQAWSFGVFVVLTGLQWLRFGSNSSHHAPS